MRIACPSCSAEYDVPDALLATGPRRLRCTRCGHAFTGALPGAEQPPPPAPPAAEAAPQAPDPSAPEPPTAVSPAPEPEPEPAGPGTGEPAASDPAPAAPRPPRDRPAPTRGPARHSPIEPVATPDAPAPATGRLAVAWIASFAVLGAAGYAVLHYQAAITAAWPPAARLYAALGLG